MQVANINQSATMSSLELVDFINIDRKERAHAAGVEFPSKGHAELQHNHFMAKVPEVLGDGAVKFLGTQTYGNNNTRNVYNFPKREACLMAMSYSYELQAKVFDRMTELEAQQQNVIALPDFNNPAIAARAWAEQYEAKTLALEVVEKQKIQLESQAYSVAYVDNFVKAEGLIGIREAGKVFGINQNALVNMLIGANVLFRENGHLQAYAQDIASGRFVSKVELDANGKARPSTKFTSKGLRWVAGKLKLDQLFQD